MFLLPDANDAFLKSIFSFLYRLLKEEKTTCLAAQPFLLLFSSSAHLFSQRLRVSLISIDNRKLQRPFSTFSYFVQGQLTTALQFLVVCIALFPNAEVERENMEVSLLTKKIVKKRVKKFRRPQSNRKICIKEDFDIIFHHL
ncbi:hypothetical protein FCM35_KLT22038 [Carex littledalei]|uniref:Uncharacterized protein n=1 Tax=Carex littledalei TaxID=544730 RepID=A0A833QC40_9POAL|nr:hypothetical protein FCM35_KLT22038 [Carex littledalei]